LNDFGVIGCANWKVTNVLSALEIKEQHSKCRKRMSDSLVHFE
jgi:hypothetical protein